MRVSTRLTMNAGASLATTGRLRSWAATSHTVARVASSVSGVRMISTSGRTATGLKKCRPASRSGCSRLAPISVTESDDVFVARMHSGETTASRSAKTCCFTLISSNTASRTKSQSAKCSYPVPPVTSEAEEAGLALVVAAFLDLALELRFDAGDGAVDDLLVQVADRDRHLEPAQEERRQLRRHQPGADDADLLHRARLGVRPADVLLGAPLDEVEGVERGLRLSARQQLGDRVLFGRVALVEAPAGRGALDQVERGVGAGRGAVERVVQLPPGFRDRLGRFGRVRGLAPGPVVSGGVSRYAIDSSRNSAGSSSASTSPSSCASAPLSSLFWRSGFVMISRIAASTPAIRGTSCVPPQAGKSPRNTSGKPKWRTAVEIVRRSQCSAISSAAAEAGAVDRRERGIGQRCDPAEELVAGPARRAAPVSGSTPWNSLMSAPAQKTNGLPVSTIPAQSPFSSSSRSRVSDSSAARPKTVGFV